MNIPTAVKKLSIKWLLVAIIVLSIALRFAGLGAVPGGVNQDEAAAGYESYSLLHHGTDRWGYKWPAYFVAWGSGQNVLESYLDIPIIAIFGLTTLTIRLWPAILGVGSVGLLFVVVRKSLGTKVALLSSLILAILPWAVMASRWGLESNILPFFMLLGVWSTVTAYESSRVKYLMPWSLIPLALVLYAYAISIFVIPFFMLGIFYLYRDVIRNQLVSFAASLIIFLIIAAPILTFFGVNMVLHRSPHIFSHLPFSAPLLLADRLNQVDSSRFDANVYYINSGFSDSIPSNNLTGFAPLALIPIPLAVIGCVLVFKRGDRRAKVFAVWLIAACAELFVADLNMNRTNTMMIPMVVLSAYALVTIYGEIRRKETKQVVLWSLSIMAVLFTGLFYYYYFDRYNAEINSDFNIGFSNMLKKADSLARPSQKIYVSNQVNLNYVYTLYYLKSDSKDFREHAKYYVAPSAIGDYYQVESFRQYYFDPLNTQLLNSKSYVFIAKGGEMPNCKTMHTSYSDSLWRVGTCIGPRPASKPQT